MYFKNETGLLDSGTYDSWEYEMEFSLLQKGLAIGDTKLFPSCAVYIKIYRSNRVWRTVVRKSDVKSIGSYEHERHIKYALLWANLFDKRCKKGL